MVLNLTPRVSSEIENKKIGEMEVEEKKMGLEQKKKRSRIGEVTLTRKID
jgi:hypothetical protein